MTQTSPARKELARRWRTIAFVALFMVGAGVAATLVALAYPPTLSLAFVLLCAGAVALAPRSISMGRRKASSLPAAV